MCLSFVLAHARKHTHTCCVVVVVENSLSIGNLLFSILLILSFFVGEGVWVYVVCVDIPMCYPDMFQT